MPSPEDSPRIVQPDLPQQRVIRRPVQGPASRREHSARNRHAVCTCLDEPDRVLRGTARREQHHITTLPKAQHKPQRVYYPGLCEKDVREEAKFVRRLPLLCEDTSGPHRTLTFAHHTADHGVGLAGLKLEADGSAQRVGVQHERATLLAFEDVGLGHKDRPRG